MHEVEIIDGVAQMAYRSSEGMPWHGLGFPVDDDMTPSEMMKVAGVDWEVQKTPTFAEMEINGEFKRLPTGQEALVRMSDGKVLTQVGPGWNPVQNAEAFDFFNDFVEKGDMMMDTAGSLKGGRIVWALADMKSGFELFGGDKVDGYLLFSNPHIYGKSIDIRCVFTRVVCANTLSVALGETGQPGIRVNHRSAFDAEKVKEVLGLSRVKMDVFKEQAEFLGSKQYKEYDLKKYFGCLFNSADAEKDSPTTERAMSYVETQPGAEFAKGSFWQLFNCTTFLADHVLGRSNDTRLESAWYGVNRDRKIKALNLALDMAKEMA
jgi:phage/plasmid-like protein (TIGR03299 family)